MKLADLPGAKAALDEAVAGLKAEGLADEWAEGMVEVVAELVEMTANQCEATSKAILLDTLLKVYEGEAAQNDQHARLLDGLPGQQAAASWHRAMAERMRAKAKAVTA